MLVADSGSHTSGCALPASARELGPRDAHHANVASANDDRLPHHVRVGGEPCAPEAVAHHHDRRGPLTIVVVNETATVLHRRAEHAEIVRRHELCDARCTHRRRGRT